MIDIKKARSEVKAARMLLKMGNHTAAYTAICRAETELSGDGCLPILEGMAMPPDLKNSVIKIEEQKL